MRNATSVLLDPLSDAKGDVFGLVAHLDHLEFLECAGRVAALVGFAITEPRSRRR